jgi:glycosyltransferase involved in cell wall biosynthesis
MTAELRHRHAATGGLLEGRRILVFVRDLEMGGTQRQAALLADLMRTHAGAEVEVWAFLGAGRAANLLEARGVPWRVQSPGIGGTAFHRALQLARFVAAVRRRRPQVLLPMTDLPNKVCGAVWRLTGASTCIWNQRDEGREVTRRPLERLALRMTPFFVSNSSAGQHFLHTRFNVDQQRVRLIPNAVALDEPIHSPSAWRVDLGLDTHTPTAVMVANLHQYKDHQTLLEAWRLVVDRCSPTPVLLLAGRHGPTFEHLCRLQETLALANTVRFLGEVEDISGLLQASTLGVFSSRLEGCPNGILECMAAGLAVVATDIPGARDALGDDAPQLVPAGDADALATAVIALLEDPRLRQSTGRANRQRVDRHFAPDRILGMYATLIRELDGAR